MKFSTDAGRIAPQCRIDRLTYFDVNSASTVETQDRVVERIDRLLTVEDLAGHLGVPVATIYAWRYHHQRPPGFRVGKHLRYRRSDVHEWIDHQLRETDAWGESPADQ